MNEITACLQAIRSAVAVLPQHGPINPAQQTFVKHIDSTAAQLLEFVLPVPESEAALQQIVPHLGDRFTRPQAALYGYARMLLDHPESFEGASPTPQQSALLETIYAQGMHLAQRTESLAQFALTERHQLRTAGPAPLDLQILLELQAPVYRYWLREAPVQFSVEVPDSPLWMMMNIYHLREFLRHVLVTMAYELIPYGRIRLIALPERSGLGISCTGIALDSAEMAQLFERQGRGVYLKQMRHYDARIETQREPGYGASLLLLMKPAMP